MNMDRKYKEAENRTSEYLELKYGTDVQSGLSLAEVRRRRHICGTYNIAKEKKRIWLIYLKKECQNPFFFFFLYLCGISRIFYFPKKIQLLLFFTLFFLIIINIRTAFRSRKIFFKQKEAKAKKVIVLREGVFQRIPWKYVLRGDIVRLKKGEQISSPVISLTKPYKEYQSGQVFTENTGRAIVIHTMDGQPKAEPPYKSWRTIMKMIATAAPKHISTPNSAAIDNGIVENATIPSIEYKNSFQNDHFVSPATRSTFSNSSHLVRNPTQPNNPFEKRLYSFISKIASTNCRFIKRKSLAPSTISACEIFRISR